ncbi:MAG: patatin-like phospholipase family protein [Bacteroidales bacterium]|nr:patatin-like phospholipase family protein [Bacteroidales bacterium]
MRKMIVLGVLLLTCLHSWAGPISLNDKANGITPRRKTVGLVLSGGGAKGVAHIGVIKVLEEAGIPIDYIAGTSMGAIVGGLYSLGFSPKAMDSLMRSQDWLALLGNKISRDNKFFTEKEVSDKTLITVPFDKDRFYISTGILSGSAVMDMLTEFTIGYHTMKTFDSLPIPFACVAYDLLSGTEVVMREGSLPLAIRASMSIPGAFTTVEREGRILVDGGVINNFPVDVVKSMGADLVIGIDLSLLTDKENKVLQEELKEADRNNLPYIVNHLMESFGKETRMRNKEMTDLYLHPDTSPYNTASFTNTAVDSLLVRGERIARENWDAIMAFKERIGISSEQDCKLPPNREPGTNMPIPDSIKIGEIYFQGLTSLNEKNLRRMLRFKEYTVVGVKEIHAALERLKGTGSFASISYSLSEYKGWNDIMFTCSERVLSAISLGVRFDTRDIASGYLNGVLAPSNLRGGMLEVTGRLSTNPYVNVGVFYQDAWLGRFGLSYRYRFGNMDMYTGADTTMRNVRFHLNTVNLDIANFYYRNFNFYLGARLDYVFSQRYIMATESFTRKKMSENIISFRSGVNYDSYDNAYYPHSGTQFHAEFALFTDDFSQYKGGKPFSSYTTTVSAAIPATERLTLVPAFYGRFIFGDEFAFVYQNYAGGNITSHYMDFQMPFYGSKPTEVVDNKYLSTAFTARYRLGKYHYIWAVANVSRISHTVLELIDWNKGMNKLGGALGYSFDSPLGPIDVMLEYGLHPGSKYGFYINFGKHF